MIRGKTSNSAKSLGGFVHATSLDQIARCLGKDEHAEEENQRPRELNRNWNSITTGVVSIGTRVIDDSCEKETDGDGPLVCADNGTSNPLWCSLRLVKGN